MYSFAMIRYICQNMAHNAIFILMHMIHAIFRYTEFLKSKLRLMIIVYTGQVMKLRLSCYLVLHSVESPSMVDPQWDIWYWGSKWNLHTVCWSAVGCEWGTTSVYFGITYVCFIPSRLPVFAVEPQCLLQDFLFLSKVSFEGHIQNLKTNSCWFKIWMGFVGPIWIKLWTSSIWGFL